MSQNKILSACYIAFSPFYFKKNQSRTIYDVDLQNCKVCSSLDHYSQNTRNFCTPNLNITEHALK